MAQDTYITYKTYMSLKLHFTSDNYDYFKYSNKVNAETEEKFKKRKDASVFYRINNAIPQSILVPFFIAQFIHSYDFNVFGLIENPIKYQKIYLDWKNRTDNMLDVYKKDLQTLANESNGSWKNLITQEEDDYPLLFKLVMVDKISKETYTLLNDLFSQTTKVYKSLENDIIYKSLNLKYRKYRPFLLPTIDDILRVTPKNLETLI